MDDELPQNELGPLYVEIDVKAHGVNYVDVMAVLGHTGSSLMVGECAGYITAVGSKSKGFCVGDRVCAWGGLPYASRVRVPNGNAYRLPDPIYSPIGASVPVVS